MMYVLLCPGPGLPVMLFLLAAWLAVAAAGGVAAGWLIWQLVKRVRGARPVKLR